MSDFKIKDSGEHEEQGTGAVRDTRRGKGRFDLIPPLALKRLADVYEKGAVKYKERNWEAGIKISRCLDSAMRHLNSYLAGDTEEDHLAQAAWNCFSAIHFEEVMPEMQDLPTRLIKTITGETLAVKETKEEHYFEAGDPVWLLSDEGKAKGSIDELADDGASVVINETGVKVFAPYHLIVYRKVLI